jgi:hypothetical protein
MIQDHYQSVQVILHDSQVDGNKERSNKEREKRLTEPGSGRVCGKACFQGPSFDIFARGQYLADPE